MSPIECECTLEVSARNSLFSRKIRMHSRQQVWRLIEGPLVHERHCSYRTTWSSVLHLHGSLSCRSRFLFARSLDLLSVIVVTAVRESSKKIVSVSFKQENYDYTVHIIILYIIIIGLDIDSANHTAWRTAWKLENVQFNLTVWQSLWFV